MPRFALAAFSRFVPPLFTRQTRHGAVASDAAPGSQPARIERLHVERAHAAAHPVHLPTPDVRRRAELGPAVRGFSPGPDSQN